MKKYLFTWILLFSCALTAFAQNSASEITGIIKDELNEPMLGVNITIKDNPGLGTITDTNGRYRIKAKDYEVLCFSFIGYDKQEIPIRDRKMINVKLLPSEKNTLDEVVVTGTGIQKKTTVTGAVTTVDMNTLKHSSGASISINNTLAGNVAGIIAKQNSGEPGQDISKFWIRGVSTFGADDGALILVDGFERSMSELNIEDIESLSVLKDASATAIYGSKGANGVVLITTKKGHAGKISIDAKVETTYNTRTRTPQFVDANVYAQMLNEALVTRSREARYTAKELDIIRMGLDLDLYPNVNWMDVLLKDGAWSETANLNISGGGTTARYYISGNFLNSNGMYKTDETLKNQYKTNSNFNRWNYRMNVDVNVTKTTLLQVGLAGSMEKQNRPGQADNIWKSIVAQTPISVPIMYSNGQIPSCGSAEDWMINPWVNATQTGYREHWVNKMQTNLSLEQKLDFITKGLSFIGRFGFDTNNVNGNVRYKRPEVYLAYSKRDRNGKLETKKVGDEIVMNQSPYNDGERTDNLEAELHYNRSFKSIHQIGATLKYSQRERVQTQNVKNIMEGISRKNQGLAGRLTYGLLGRYFMEFNFGYTGSENFSTGNQFGFFPAVSGAWNIAEEKFIKKHLPWMDMFKIRYSYGEVGNDNVGQRYPYLTNFGDYNSWDHSDFGSTNRYIGLHYSQVASPSLSWEISKKHNLGLDLSLFNGGFSLTVDVFKDTREDIYMQRNYLPEITGVDSRPWANVGKMQLTGVDGNMMFHRKFGEFDLTVRANMTLSKNEVLNYDEEQNTYPYKMVSGYRWGQVRGLISEGLFKDYDDIRNSPRQYLGEYAPGDIKYKDVNGDGIITDLDMVPIGATNIPSAIYGVGASLHWKNFDLNVHFQGAGSSSYHIQGGGVNPFRDSDMGNILTDVANPGNRWIAKEISGTPDTENVNAKYPRLSYGGSSNNQQYSTFWIRNGSYLRFKTLELGYTFPKKWMNKLYMNNVRLYFLGSNLAVWDSLRLWDPELASDNGAAYPLTKSFTLGLNVNF